MTGEVIVFLSGLVTAYIALLLIDWASRRSRPKQDWAKVVNASIKKYVIEEEDRIRRRIPLSQMVGRGNRNKKDEEAA